MARSKKQKPVATPAAIPPEARHVLFRVMSCTDEDGVMSSAPVPVYMNDYGQFIVKLPPHLVKHCERTEVYSDRLVDMVQTFEQINEDYSITTLHGKAAKPMLLVALRDIIRADARHHALLDVGVMMGITQVSVNPAVPGRVYLREDEKTLTMFVNLEPVKPYILLPDTPEINDRLNAMLTSIFDASNVLRTLIDAPDPAAVLLSLAGPWTPKVETPGSAVIVDPPAAANSTINGGAFASDDEI